MAVDKKSLIEALQAGRDRTEAQQAAQAARKQADAERLIRSAEIGLEIISLVDVLKSLAADEQGVHFESVLTNQITRLCGSVSYAHSAFDETKKNIAIIIDAGDRDPYAVYPHDVSDRAGSEDEVSEATKLGYRGDDLNLAAQAILNWAGRVAPHRADEIAAALQEQ